MNGCSTGLYSSWVLPEIWTEQASMNVYPQGPLEWLLKYPAGEREKWWSTREPARGRKFLLIGIPRPGIVASRYFPNRIDKFYRKSTQITIIRRSAQRGATWSNWRSLSYLPKYILVATTGRVINSRARQSKRITILRGDQPAERPRNHSSYRPICSLVIWLARGKNSSNSFKIESNLRASNL